MNMKTAIIIAAGIASASAVTAQDRDITMLTSSVGPVYSVDSRDIDRLDGRIDGARADLSDARNYTAGTAALGAIDFVRQAPQIGFGLSSVDSRTGWAVNGMVPLGDRAHGSIGAFGAGDDVGVAGAFVIGF